MRFLLLMAAGLPLAAQTVILGTSSDPCTGGSPLTIAGTTNTVRWSSGSFVCTFPISAAGAYIVEMRFLEPCAAAGACAGGAVTGQGQRVLNAYLNDSPVLSGLDIFASGATDKQTASRWAIVYATPASGIVVRVETRTRAAVLAAVSIGLFAQISLTRSTCVGKASTSDCAGVELWALQVAGVQRSIVGIPMPATLPPCPNSKACWKPIPIWQ